MIRSYRPSDLKTLLEINQAGTPGVSPETAETLETWINLSRIFLAVDAANHPIGFLTLVKAGTRDYPSDNLRWFEAYIARTGRNVIYVDRIAVAASARGQNVGEKLYQATFDACGEYDEIGCEINTRPPNPGSTRFHQRLGFTKVGQRMYGTDNLAVAYYVRSLSGSSG